MSDPAEHSDTAPATENPAASSQAVDSEVANTEPGSDVANAAAATEEVDSPAETAAPAKVSPAATASEVPAASGGPISLERIRQLRLNQQAAGRPRKPSPRPATQPDASPAPAPADTETKAAEKDSRPSEGRSRKPRDRGNTRIPTPEPLEFKPTVAVPSTRQPLSRELEDELNAALGGSDLDNLLVGDSMLQVGHQLEEGQRIAAIVMKAHGEFVFFSLGGPNEGVMPALHFENPPEVGAQIEVIVRGFLPQEGLYELTIPGNAVAVSDWGDLKEGDVVEAIVTGSNTGGLECKVGSIGGFIPASQVAEYRIENLADMVEQKVLCVVTEVNPRRGNLVLSRRAVLEREKKEKREERLASLEIGAAVEGVVRKILDFGAFVDIGGVDGLLHISQLSWDRVKHPSEVLEEGQKIQVRIDKLDEATGKIGLSFRALQENPWDDIEARFPAGSVVHGAVTRIAEFGAFVRIATGVEGLVHLSELAHHRVHSVGNVVQEGQEVDVKVLSVEPEKQRISLSLKAGQARPQAAAEESTEATAEEQPRPQPVLPKHRGPLKGGTGHAGSGEQFGLKW